MFARPFVLTSDLSNESFRARLSAFSAHIQHILETRKSLERDVQEVDVGDESNVQKVSKGSSKVARKLRFAFLCLGMTPSLRLYLHQLQRSASTEQLHSSRSTKLRNSQLLLPMSNEHELRRNLLQLSLTSLPRLQAFQATVLVIVAFLLYVSYPFSLPISAFLSLKLIVSQAIRNVPSVVLHESADEESFASETENANDESASERVASPPPPPRVVEPSRQLPTCESTYLSLTTSLLINSFSQGYRTMKILTKTRTIWLISTNLRLRSG